MQDVLLQKLKVSLTESIEDWVIENSALDEWDAFDTHLGDFTAELMADAAFTVLMAQKDLTAYYKQEEMLKDE